MIKKRYVILASGIVSVLLGSLFVSNIILAQTNGEYDPWIDTNDDGTIDVNDLATLGSIYGTSGEAINKTELLLDLLDRVEALENESLPLGYIGEPAYDSGLVSSSTGTLTHNLNRTTVLVYVVAYHSSIGYHTHGYGQYWGWELLTRTTITLYSYPNGYPVSHLRVRMWIMF